MTSCEKGVNLPVVWRGHVLPRVRWMAAFGKSVLMFFMKEKLLKIR